MPEGAAAEPLGRAYRNEVVFLDQQLAPFMDWMRESGVYDETLVVLASDHGTELGEHGGFWHGTTLYEEQIHVPLVVRLPGNEHAGTRAPWQTRLLDVAPTLTSALGLNAHSSWEGSDLLADIAEVTAADSAEEPGAGIEDEPAGVEEPDAAPDEGASDEEPVEEAGAHEPPAPEPAAEPQPPPPRERVVVAEARFEGHVITAIRWDGFKYIQASEGNPRGLPPEALFDLVEDPGETSNRMGTSTPIAGESPEDVAAMLAGGLRQALSGTAEGPAEEPP
jgi:arylsulfatase A-like enzyme